MFLFSHSNLCPSTILKYLNVDLNLIVLKFCLQARAGAIPSEQLRLQPKQAALFLAPEMILEFFFTASGEGTCRYSAEILAMLGIFLSVLLRSNLHVSCN